MDSYITCPYQIADHYCRIKWVYNKIIYNWFYIMYWMNLKDVIIRLNSKMNFYDTMCLSYKTSRVTFLKEVDPGPVI